MSSKGESFDFNLQIFLTDHVNIVCICDCDRKKTYIFFFVFAHWFAFCRDIAGGEVGIYFWLYVCMYHELNVLYLYKKNACGMLIFSKIRES